MHPLHPAGHQGYGFRGIIEERDPSRVIDGLFSPLAELCGGVAQFNDPSATGLEYRKGTFATMRTAFESRPVNNAISAALADGSHLFVVGYGISHRPIEVRHSEPSSHAARPDLYGPYLEKVLLPWLRAALAAGIPLVGQVVRVGTDVSVCAYPPIAGPFQVVITTRAAVEAAYDDPSVFWSMFPGVEAFGERLLLTRHLDKHTEDVFFPEAWREGWALARVAKAKRNRFTGFRLKPWTEPGYMAGAGTLGFVGYHPERKDAEYAAVLGPEEHVLGREIHGLRRVLQLKKLPDGTPCESVRVVFSDEATAHREKRPILDVGASVGFVDPDGELVLVDEADRATPRECELQGTLWR
jgi:hypothetical protein